jgi:hypothetical protein
MSRDLSTNTERDAGLYEAAHAPTDDGPPISWQDLDPADDMNVKTHRTPLPPTPISHYDVLPDLIEMVEEQRRREATRREV